MSLSKDILKFLVCLFWEVPKFIAVIFKRVLILVNNEASFILNIKMLFVPLFGDYTWIGRLMGFVYRIIKVILGLLLLVFLILLGIVCFIGWYVLFILALYFLEYWIVLLFLFSFLLWKITTRNHPNKKVSEISDDEFVSCFRPRAVSYVEAFVQGENEALSRFFNNKDVINILKRLELNNSDFKSLLGSDSDKINFNKLISTSFKYAKEFDSKFVEVDHLFLGIISNHNNSDRFLSKFDLTLEICENGVRWILDHRKFLSQVYFWQPDYEVPVIGGVNRAKTGRVTPALDSVSIDFTKMARDGTMEKITGHTESTSEIVKLLGSSDSKGILIIGPPGSGKTSIVKRIAQQIIEGTKESPLKFKRLVSINAGSLISGASSSGEISGRIDVVMEDVRGSGNIILFFDEIHNLVLGGSSGGSEIFSLLEPYFSANEFQIIGATDLRSYRKYIEPNGSFSRIFKIVEIEETSKEETIEILEHVSRNFEKDNGVFISYPALCKTVELSSNLIHERVFPDKAIKVLSRTVSNVKKGDKYVESEDVKETTSKMTGVPTTTMGKKDSNKLLNIEKEMKKRIIGQDEAINKIGKAMKRAGAGVRDEDKPIASFLFVGTTGVGKTETAKVLANYYFGSEDKIIRLDMSEYQHEDSIERLLGSSGGNTEGLLTEAVRKSPSNLILLDEIEKAHQRVILAFLQVLDDGRLTDSTGRTVDFTNTIIISTSNVGTRSIQKVSESGGSFDELKESAMADVRDHFAPELLNRFSGVVVYNPLDVDSVKKITKLLLEKVRQRVKEKGVSVKFKPELISELVDRGYSKEWGARPLRRVIEDSVETYLAVRILSGDIQKGNEITVGTEVFE